jgi:S-adenosylmethionine:tRNA-ribosyltransferase-isomerase (queuine synthetase)
VPLYNTEGRCCNICNITRVIPARLMLKEFRDGKNEKHLHSDEE